MQRFLIIEVGNYERPDSFDKVNKQITGIYILDYNRDD